MLVGPGPAPAEGRRLPDLAQEPLAAVRGDFEKPPLEKVDARSNGSATTHSGQDAEPHRDENRDRHESPYPETLERPWSPIVSHATRQAVERAAGIPDAEPEAERRGGPGSASPGTPR